MSRKQEELRRIWILKKILEKKDVLFGAFSSKLTHKDKENAWKGIFNESKANGFLWTESQNWRYLRDTVWGSNLKSKTLKKVDSKMGAADGEEKKLTEVDLLVLEILSKDSPTVCGIKSSMYENFSPIKRKSLVEDMPGSSTKVDDCRHTWADFLKRPGRCTVGCATPNYSYACAHRVERTSSAHVPVCDEQKSYFFICKCERSFSAPPIFGDSRDFVVSEDYDNNDSNDHVTEIEPKTFKKRKICQKADNTEDEIIFLKKRRLQLQIEGQELANYKFKLEIIKLEKELNIEHKFDL